MENLNESKPDLLLSTGLQVDEQSSSHLKDAGLWAKSIAIISAVIGGLAIMSVLIFGGTFGRLGSYSAEGYFIGMITGITIVAAIALIAIISLFRFSSGMVNGINNQDTAAFEKGITGLKTYFILVGVLTLLFTFVAIVRLIN